ncbi:hypothetical protein GIB67_013897 [Kingdonia uniflora]|uniref:CG-1 domain-containing protein n=1 Tax=Kingdonia uniflora TaxID=39325 RepID=A0A7J7LDK8_9MAGN|nr:hypothetical protein GIB67_013897 [Kingdonia uniflora]
MAVLWKIRNNASYVTDLERSLAEINELTNQSADPEDIERILLEAQTRWLRPAEICEILRNHNKFRIAPEPPNKPPSGSLFLFDRKVLRYFRKDGHSWRKKKDGKTVKEAHERLKAGSVDVLHCYYAHGEDNESFQRRSYWMLEEEFMHIVLVHYREVKGNKTSFGRPRETEDVISSSQISSPLSSSYVTNHSHAPSQTTDSTSLNSAHTSEYEDVESDIYQTSSGYHSYPELQQSGNMPSTSVMASNLLGSYFPSYPNNQYSYQGKQSATSETNYTSHFEENQGRVNNGSGFGVNFEGRKELDLASWEEVFEHCTSGLENTPATMGFPLKQENVMLGQRMTQENVMLGQRMTQELNMKEEFVETHGKEKWQISPDVPKWKMDQNIDADFSSDLYTRSHVQKHNATEPFWMYSEEQNRQLSDGDLGCILEDNITVTGNFNDSEKGLKKLDSFTRWMSSELGEVGESPMESNSGVYWDTIEGDTVDAGTSVSPQVNLEAYLLSPSLSQEQLFSIVDFSPNWAYTDSETKVLITGMFLKNQEDVRKCKWSCMFGEVEVPVEILADGVLRCHAPAHTDGRVPFYVTCSNRLACSEVREFEFRTNLSRDSEMIDLYRGSTTDTDVLRTRFGKLLSLGSAGQLMSPSVCEKPEISNKINSLMKKENDEWSQMLELTSEKEFSPGKVKDHLLEKILKENLHSWLLHKVTEDGKGPNVLDKEGQGVLHLAAALGYDWAIEPTIAAGVSINFRDISGWTALHWAAFCGR